MTNEEDVIQSLIREVHHLRYTVQTLTTALFGIPNGADLLEEYQRRLIQDQKQNAASQTDEEVAALMNYWSVLHHNASSIYRDTQLHRARAKRQKAAEARKQHEQHATRPQPGGAVAAR